ncbi:MAG: N-acetylmuramoyl-L-alanine amidase, partial [Myxococcales bacterium]|nr:N-acetylmuramoyl-L-alanine amidase [Myxococcales bacterium]
ERLHRSTLAAGRRVFPGLSDRGVRSAMFYVLVGARMPALLLEASFLTHSEDARALRSPRYRESLGDGIAEGIVGYAAASSGASSAP